LHSEQAAAYTRVGRINEEIGSKEAALAAYQQALAIRTDLATLHPDDHAAEAMDALRRAIAGGYRAVDPKNFSALQSRHDFQSMMLDLAFPKWPFVGKPNP